MGSKQMLCVTPCETLRFLASNNNEVGVHLTCMYQSPIMFKIQTTSPDKFRVRPRCGVLEPNQTLHISIILKPEHQLTESPREKFLILAAPALMEEDLTTPQNIAAVWKQKYGTYINPDFEQHRLTCTYGSKDRLAQTSMQSTVSEVIELEEGDHKMDQLALQASQMEKQLRLTQALQYLTLFVLLIVSVAVVFLLRFEAKTSRLPIATSPAPPPAISTRPKWSEKFYRFRRQPCPSQQ